MTSSLIVTVWDTSLCSSAHVPRSPPTTTTTPRSLRQRIASSDVLIICAGDKFYFFQRNHPFGSNRLAHPGLNHLRTHSQAPRRNSPLAEVNHGVKGAESREVIIIPLPLLLLTVSSAWKGPRVQPRSRPTRGDTRPSTGHFTWSSAWRGRWGGGVEPTEETTGNMKGKDLSW